MVRKRGLMINLAEARRIVADNSRDTLSYFGAYSRQLQLSTTTTNHPSNNSYPDQEYVLSIQRLSKSAKKKRNKEIHIP